MNRYKDWFFEVAYKPAAKPKETSLEKDGIWIIFVEATLLAKELVSTLQNHNQKAILIAPGQDWTSLVQAISDPRKLTGVVYMWGYEGLSSAPTLESINAYLESVCGGLVQVANTFAQPTLLSRPRLWVVNSSIVSDGSQASLVQTSLSALCKVIRDEYPSLHCTRLALDPQTTDSENAQILFSELSADSDEPQVAWQGQKRFVERMVKANITPSSPPQFPAEASYLVAGGLRPLGLKIAQWYVAHGARNIILLDEVNSRQEAIADLEQMKAAGAQVTPVAANYENESKLKATLDAIQEQFPQLKGIIHAAGLIDDDLLLRMSWDRFNNVHRLKVGLSWCLHEWSLNLKLDHFILFSSCLWDIAPHGKANSTTGNSFLNALSYYRKKKGLPSLTINWAPWETRSMIVRHVVDNLIANRMHMLRIEEGLQVFDILFSSQKANIMAVNVKWKRLLRELPNKNPFYEDVAPNISITEPQAIELDWHLDGSGEF